MSKKRSIRKRFPHKFLLRLDDYTYRELSRVAGEFNETKSKVIRQLIKMYIHKLAEEWRKASYTA